MRSLKIQIQWARFYDRNRIKLILGTGLNSGVFLSHMNVSQQISHNNKRGEVFLLQKRDVNSHSFLTKAKSSTEPYQWYIFHSFLIYSSWQAFPTVGLLYLRIWSWERLELHSKTFARKKDVLLVIIFGGRNVLVLTPVKSRVWTNSNETFISFVSEG